MISRIAVLEEGGRAHRWVGDFPVRWIASGWPEPRTGHIRVAGLQRCFTETVTSRERSYPLLTDSNDGAPGERRVRISRIGGWPKRRLYSRLNWLALSYPTSKAALARVHAIDEHASSRCLQPKLLLILKRTHGGQRAEMVVQRGQTHTRDLCEIFHP